MESTLSEKVQNLVRINKLKKWFRSPTRLPAVDIGTNVVIKVPDLVRGRLAPRNVLAVVVDVNTSGFCLLGMKEGLLERLYARSEFIAADNNFTEAHMCPQVHYLFGQPQ